MDDKEFLEYLGVSDSRSLTYDDIGAAITLIATIGFFTAVIYFLINMGAC